MARYTIGKIALTPKGEYNSSTAYTKLDVVQYNGSGYVCKVDCNGVLPTNTTNWMLLVKCPTQADIEAVVGTTFEEIDERLDEQSNAIIEVDNKVNSITGNIVEYDADNTLESIYEGKQIQVPANKVGYSLSSLYKANAANFRNKRIDVSGVDRIEWWAYASSSNYGSFFLDANDIVVKTETTQTAGIKSRTIPTNAKWFIWEYSIAHETIYCKLITEQQFSVTSDKVLNPSNNITVKDELDVVEDKINVKTLNRTSISAQSLTFPIKAGTKYRIINNGNYCYFSTYNTAVVQEIGYIRTKQYKDFTATTDAPYLRVGSTDALSGNIIVINLSSYLMDETEKVKEILNNSLIDEMACSLNDDFTAGKYWMIPSAGNAVTLETSSIKDTLAITTPISVSEGDYIYVRTRTVNNNITIIALTDDNGVVIDRKLSGDGNKDLFIVVPTGATKLYLNAYGQDEYFYCYINPKFFSGLWDALNDTKSEIEQKADSRALMLGWATNIDVPFEQGHLKDDGTDGSSTAAKYPLRVRTGFLPNTFEQIICDKNLTMNYYKYNLDGSFTGEWSSWANEISATEFDFTNYKYRMTVKRIPEWNITPTMAENGIYFLANKMNYPNNENSSMYYKKVDFGVPPTEPYFGLQSDYSFGRGGTQTSEIIAKYDTLVDNDYITKLSIGIASDGSNMYVYKTHPVIPQNAYGTTGLRVPYKPLKMIIICGQHGFEKSSMYATYYFLKDLVENYMQSPLLRYIRNTLQLIIVPCANPYGIDQSIYKNGNQVNLNRNWPVKNWTGNITDQTSQQYQGEAAGDQPEVQNIVSVIQDNLDAFFAIDFHTQGSGVVDSKSNINWLSMKSVENDNMSDKWLQACMYHLKNISTLFNALYPTEVGGNVTDACGRMDNSTSQSTTGYLDAYFWEQGIMGCTFEGNNGLPAESSAYSATSKKACSELLGNFISAICNMFSNN